MKPNFEQVLKDLDKETNQAKITRKLLDEFGRIANLMRHPRESDEAFIARIEHVHRERQARDAMQKALTEDDDGVQTGTSSDVRKDQSTAKRRMRK